MKTLDELFNIAIEHWRERRCVGSCIIPPPINDKNIVLDILQRIYYKTPNANVLITTRDFNERIDLITFLTNQNDEENDKEFKELIANKTLRLFTIDYIERNGTFFLPFVLIVYHCDTIGKHLEELIVHSKFKIIVLNKLMSSVEDMNKLYSLCPLLDDFKQNELDEIRTSTPVEEEWIDVTIPEDTESYKLLSYYNEYVTTSIRIFGSFDLIQQARVGNAVLNISANQICNQIAYDNGWNEHLDMSVSLNVDIDNLYNPANLRDRATQTYEIIRNRANLLSDYEGKLDKILDIVEQNKDSKILIISKRAEFASIITDFINQRSEDIICGNYHDKLEPVLLTDSNGNPVLYKSGENKGKRRYICSKAQKTLNQNNFNNGVIRILSASAAPDKDLHIDVDVIIITSPLCEDIKSYMYRLTKVFYPKGKIKLYSIYVKNSLEQRKLENKQTANNHIISNKAKNLVINENNSDFVLVD